jgi:hypothetical protein
VRSSAEAARGELDAARSELGAARVELAGAREQLQRERAARAEAGASLQERIGELERVAATASSPERLERLAAEQAQASAARESSAAPADIAARLDAAAAALRARETQPAPEVPVADEVRVPVARPTGQGPVLRSAIVRLAKDDPDAAGRLLAALLPAQGGVVEGARSYDVTIKGVGTYAITMQDGHARAARVGSPRSRRAAAFHLSADPLVLAELLTGVEHRIGRFFGPARLRGRRRRLAALEPLVTRPPDLTTVARSGARIEPDLAWRVLGYAVHPSWTRGLEFTVAQTIVEATTERTWYLTARDGGGLAVTTVEPETPPAATVTMSRTAFDRLLRDEPYAPGDRPTVRGDREAVGTLLDLADRAARG